jgi:hypothetical protein
LPTTPSSWYGDFGRQIAEPQQTSERTFAERTRFSVDQSVFLPAGDRAGIERLVIYMTADSPAASSPAEAAPAPPRRRASQTEK